MEKKDDSNKDIIVRIKNKPNFKKKIIRKERVGIRVTKEQKEQITQEAKKKNVSVSHYILDKVFNPAYMTRENISKYNSLCQKMADIQDNKYYDIQIEPELENIFDKIVTLFEKRP